MGLQLTTNDGIVEVQLNLKEADINLRWNIRPELNVLDPKIKEKQDSEKPITDNN
jgi:hypothetical protein